MTLEIYLDYLDPPGAPACMWKPSDEDPAKEVFEEVMLVLFGKALYLCMLGLQTRMMEAGKIKHGKENPQKWMEAWQKTARPIAYAKFGTGLYLLMYSPMFADAHPLVKQGWLYLKVALDVVSDDFAASKITYTLAGLRHYGDEVMPLRLVEEMGKLPPLEFV